ncbi:MAG: aspartyl/glutamyl-tRNA amidotransferase subunit A, partial [Flavobacteriales bacterium]|nr:aspartyl/glutamyl-tRNA amidotransferase subunit A [Flavobacteriales bacterium]
FAMGSSNETSAYGQVGNPLDPARVPGGSSGGAAASVAAGTCHIALASDTGGSIRQPASFCGVAGFKPTYGRVSRYGLIAFASSFDQVGPLAHDVEDLQAVQAVIAGPDDRDNTTSHRPFATADVPAKLRIGYYAQCLDVPGMDPEVRDRTLAEIDRLRAEGHSVVPVELAHADLFVPTYYILSTAEASSNLARFDGIRYGHRAKEAQGVEDTYRRSRSEGFGPEVQRRILLGTFVLSAGYYDAYYGQGMKVRRIIRDNTLETLAGLDLLLTPTCPSTAFLKGQISDPVTMYLQDIFTVQANLAGIPALSIPAGQHSNGMPFGIQLMAKPFEDERLLAAARRLFPC